MAEKKVRIIPLDVGILGCDQSLMTLRRGMGKTVDLPFMAWYVEGLEKKVLIDTGPPSQERGQRLHKSLNPRVSKEQETPQRLIQLGIQPEEIEIVILTHLHWDHVGQVDKFTKAQIFVSQKEFDSAMSAPSPSRAGYETLLPGVEPVFMKSIPQFEFLDMAEEEILPGLKVFPTPGHTNGAISVEVMTSDGPYIAASDAVSTYDLLRGDPSTNQRFLMPGIYVDMAATYNSIQRIYRRAQYDINRVIAGHDYEALNKGSFPAK